MKLSLRMIIFPIFVAVSMSLGLLLGLKVHVYSSSVATYGIPVGLFFMIYPVMTKVRLEEVGKSIRDLKTLGLMVLLNYAVDPFLVAGLVYSFMGYTIVLGSSLLQLHLKLLLERFYSASPLA